MMHTSEIQNLSLFYTEQQFFSLSLERTQAAAARLPLFDENWPLFSVSLSLWVLPCVQKGIMSAAAAGGWEHFEITPRLRRPSVLSYVYDRALHTRLNSL